MADKAEIAEKSVQERLLDDLSTAPKRGESVPPACRLPAAAARAFSQSAELLHELRSGPGHVRDRPGQWQLQPAVRRIRLRA